MSKSMNDVEHFVKFAADRLGIDKIPKINFVGHEHDSKGTFGIFQPKTHSIEVRTVDRHPIDVMRTVAHELAHHKWKLDGNKNTGNAGSADEDYANAIAGEIMRDYDTTHVKTFKSKPIKESDGLGPSPVNSMGSSSSTPMTGGIDTLDPFLSSKKKLRKILKRRRIEEIRNDGLQST